MPEDVPPGSVYTFVNGIEAALEKAKRLAGGKDVSVAGANVGQQFLQRGFVDEMVVHLVPVVFGSGTPLCGDLNSKHVVLETVGVVETKETIHLRFRVVKCPHGPGKPRLRSGLGGPTFSPAEGQES